MRVLSNKVAVAASTLALVAGIAIGAGGFALIDDDDSTSASASSARNQGRDLDELLDEGGGEGEAPAAAVEGAPPALKDLGEREIPGVADAEVSLKSTGGGAIGFRHTLVSCFRNDITITVGMTAGPRVREGNTFTIGDSAQGAVRFNFYQWDGTGWVWVSSSNWYQTTISGANNPFPPEQWTNLGSGQVESFPFVTNQFSGYTAVAIQYYWFPDANHDEGYIGPEWAINHTDYDDGFIGYCYS
jgi:hypothetical protein